MAIFTFFRKKKNSVTLKNTFFWNCSGSDILYLRNNFFNIKLEWRALSLIWNFHLDDRYHMQGNSNVIACILPFYIIWFVYRWPFRFTRENLATEGTSRTLVADILMKMHGSFFEKKKKKDRNIYFETAYGPATLSKFILTGRIIKCGFYETDNRRERLRVCPIGGIEKRRNCLKAYLKRREREWNGFVLLWNHERSDITNSHSRSLTTNWKRGKYTTIYL